MIKFKIEHDIVTKSDLGEVNIKHVFKDSETGKIIKIFNNDNFLICKSDDKECWIEKHDIV
ncbi:15951_t:CDS:2, partial [Cetraspora pellucida]